MDRIDWKEERRSAWLATVLKPHKTKKNSTDDLTCGRGYCLVLAYAAPGASALPSLTRQSSTAMRLNVSGLTRMAELKSLQLRWISAMGTCGYVFVICTKYCDIPLAWKKSSPRVTFPSWEESKSRPVMNEWDHKKNWASHLECANNVGKNWAKTWSWDGYSWRCRKHVYGMWLGPWLWWNSSDLINMGVRNLPSPSTNSGRGRSCLNGDCASDFLPYRVWWPVN